MILQTMFQWQKNEQMKTLWHFKFDTNVILSVAIIEKRQIDS